MRPGPRRLPICLLAALLTAYAAGGCIRPRSVTCSDGRICPPESRCDVERHRCVTNEQETACLDHAERAGCMFAGAPGWCHGGTCELLICGDDMRSGTESCDGADLDGKTCASLKYRGETTGLRCTPECTFDESGCVDKCGDQAINGPEACDGSNLGGADCQSAGFYEAAGLRCSPSCTFDITDCRGFCGDAVTNGLEVCDGAPPLGMSCLDLGFDRGLLGCSELCGGAVEACDRFGWQQIASAPATAWLNKVWGTGLDDLFAVGDRAGIFHWDGASWSSTTTSGALNGSRFFGVWGSSSRDVFVVGIGLDRKQAILRLSTGSSPQEFRPGQNGALLGVWGLGADDVFAVGDGTIVRWNGASWSTTIVGTGLSLQGVWGSGPTDVYAVGGNLQANTGTILRYDGARWSDVMAPPGPLYYGVWGSGRDDVFAVGRGGTIAHWDGVTWSLDSTRTTRDLTGVWGRGRNDVFAVGAGGTTLHWDGGAWSETTARTTIDLTGVWGFGDDVVAVAGDRLLKWSGMTISSAATLPPLDAAWASGPDDVFAVGGMNVWHWDGRSWSATALTDPDRPTFTLSAVWGSGPRDVIAVGSMGAIFHWDGTAWSPTVSPTPADLTGVWGSSPNDFYVVGGLTGVGVIFHWRNDRWISATPIGGPPPTLRGVWGSGPSDIFAVGDQGAVAHYDGTPWHLTAVPTTPTFSTFGSFHGVWGTGPNNVFIVGDLGTIVHFDGTEWSAVKSGVTATLWTVGGRGAADVFVGGDVLLHLRSGTWEPIALPVGASVRGLAVSPARVDLVGTMGAIHLDRRLVTCVGPERSCRDGWDNDCDGLPDAADGDCAGKIVELCANDIDDDADGSKDCVDPDCASFPACRH